MTSKIPKPGKLSSFVLLASLVFLLSVSAYRLLARHPQKQLAPPAPAFKTKVFTPQSHPESFYLTPDLIRPLIPAGSDIPQETYLPYYHYQLSGKNYVLFKSKAGIQRYEFSPDSLTVILSEAAVDSSDFRLIGISNPIYQYKNNSQWLDYSLSPPVRTSLNPQPRSLTLTQVMGPASVIWEFALTPDRPILKNSFRLIGRKNEAYRLLWQISSPSPATTTDIKHQTFKLGDVWINWGDFSDQNSVSAQLSADKKTLNVVFYPNGQTGNLDIDPTISAALVGNYIEVDDGTRFWCFGPGQDSGPSTLEFWQPGRFYHANTGDPASCTSGGDNLFPGDRSGSQAAYDSFLNELSFFISNSAANVISLLETSPTRVVIQSYRENLIDSTDSFGKFTVYPNGYGYVRYDLGNVTNGGGSGGFYLHYDDSGSAPQIVSRNSTDYSHVISDITANNYAGLAVLPFRRENFTNLRFEDSNITGDYNGWYGEWSDSGGSDYRSINFLMDWSNYRSTSATRDRKSSDFIYPDVLADGLINAQLWDQFGPQTLMASSGFEGADSNLCNGGDGFTSGTCGGTSPGTAVGNYSADKYTGSFSARFTQGSSTDSTAYATANISTASWFSARFAFQLLSETLGDNQDFGLFSFNRSFAAGHDILYLRQLAAGNLRLCIITDGSTLNCGNTDISPFTWYNIEFTNTQGTSFSEYPPEIRVFLNGSQELAISGYGINSATSASIGIIDSETAGNDILIDNFVVSGGPAGPIGFNPSEGAYTLHLNTWPADIGFELDRGAYTAPQSVFLIRNWKSHKDPAQILLNGRLLANGTDFNADILPFAESWINDSDGVCGTGGWHLLADAGNTADADEYLMDAADDFSFQNGGTGSNCTWGDSSSDALYFGRKDQFSGLNVSLGTAGAGSASVAWEYCSANTDIGTACDTWTALSMNSYTPGVANFTASGNMYFTPPSQWIRSTENSGKAGLFYIRARVSSGSYSTYPVEDKITSDILALQHMGEITGDNNQFILKPHSSIAELKFDEASGSTANDASGNSHPFTISGPAWKISGSPDSRVNRHTYLSFDGVNDFVSRSADSDFDPAHESFTVTGWFRHPSTQSGTDTILSRASGINGIGYKIYMNSAGSICFGIDDTAGSFPEDSACTTQSFADSTWHHFAAVKTMADSISLYIDGHQLASDTSLGSRESLNTSSPVYIGIDADGTSNPWTGDLDQITFYSYALSAAQIYADIPDPTGALFGANPIDPLTNGLVGWWKMDEASGNASDSSGNTTTLTDVNTVARVGAKFSYGGDFESTASEYFFAADNSHLSLTGSLTLAAWIRPESVSSGMYNIIAKWDGANESYRLLQNGDEIRLELDSSGNYQETVSANLSASNFYHVAGVYDHTTRSARIYINGSEAASSTTGTIPASIGDDTGRFHLGAEDSTTTAANFYDGYIDDARVYSRALTPAEIQSLYNWAAGPIGWWKSDENTGQTLADSSGNGYNGFRGDNSSVETDEPSWATGKIGGALDYDGVDDSAYIGSDLPLFQLGTQSLTVSAWVWRDTSGSNDYIVSNRVSGGTEGFDLVIYGTNEFAIFIRDDEGDFYECYTAPGAVAVGAWHHLAGVIDKTALTCQVYINGVPSTAASLGTLSLVGNITNPTINDPLFIGSHSDLSGTFFDGKIDDVRIYNYARTPAQIIEDMNGGHPTGGSPIGSHVAYWKFDEMNGSTAYDDSINSNNLTLSSASWTTSGKFNGAWNGTGALWLSRADDADFDVSASDDYTISLWFKSDSATNPSSTEYLFNKANATTAGYAVYANTSGQVCFGIDDDTTWGPDVASCSTADVYDNSWHHLVAVRNVGSDQLQLYVDGLLVDSDTDPTTATLANSLSLYVGDRDGVDNGDEFNGDIDEIKVFRSALTPEQVKIVMNANSIANFGVGVDEKQELADGAGNPPIAYWSLDENTGTSAFDKSGNNLTGTLVDGPTWAPGMFGGALNFDGNNDRVDVVSSTILNNLSTLSITAWIYPRSFGEGNFGRIINKDNGTNTQLLFNMLNNTGQNSIRFYRGRATTDTYIDAANNSIALNVWQHVAVVYSTSASIGRMYINGQEVNYALQQIGSGGLNSDAGEILQIGGRTGGRYFDGFIDEVKIWNYALTPSQVAYEYNRGKPIVWYKFDECLGTTANNTAPTAAGNDAGNDATITIGASGSNTSTGACNSGSSTEAWNNGTAGKANSSLDFDGTDDYAASPNAALIAANSVTYSNVSWGGWFNPATSPTSDTLLHKNNEFRLTTNASGNPQCQIYSSGAWQTAITASSALPVNSWSHLICAYDGANIRLYLNGILAASGSQTASITSTNTTALSVARDPAGSGYFDGRIDQIQVFTYALSLQQIRNLMNEGAVKFAP